MAFKISEEVLGIRALLDIEALLSSPPPDQSSLIPYLAQFYQMFRRPPPPPLARDSGLSSFKNSSTEEEVVRRAEVSCQSLERENPFRRENSEDADDEMGDLVVVVGGERESTRGDRRRRPSSLSFTDSPARARQERRRRGGGRSEEKTLKRKLGGQAWLAHSDLPRPYQPTQLAAVTVKRRRSEDLVMEDNINNETVMRLRESRDQMIERVVQVSCYQEDLLSNKVTCRPL